MIALAIAHGIALLVVGVAWATLGIAGDDRSETLGAVFAISVAVIAVQWVILGTYYAVTTS